MQDLAEMTGYDTEARVELTEWSLEHRTQLHGMVILVSSRLVAMGVATVGMAGAFVGLSVDSYTDRLVWERRVASLLPSSV